MSRQRGFTLLEVMIALAILAVGSICVLSMFGAALALQVRRESDIRTAEALEDARREAQDAFDSFLPTKKDPVPAPIADRIHPRLPGVSYSVQFTAIPGVATTEGVQAKVTVDDGAGRVRGYTLFLGRSLLPRAELKTSRSFDQEKEDETKAEKESSGDSKKRKKGK